MTLAGMPGCEAVSGAWAITRPPSDLTVRAPQVPSVPVPDSTMAMARSPSATASERKKWSMTPRKLPAIRHLPHAEETLIDRERAVRRDDVDVVGFERLAILGVRDREPCHVGKKLGHEALMRRIEVHDDNEDEPGLWRHGAEERLERLEAAGRRPQADNEATPGNRLVRCRRRRRTVGWLLRSASRRGEGVSCAFVVWPRLVRPESWHVACRRSTELCRRWCRVAARISPLQTAATEAVGSSFRASGVSSLTVSTGHGAMRTTRSATLPMRA